jgi:hypothetical protein
MVDFSMVSGEYKRLEVAVKTKSGGPQSLAGVTNIIWSIGQTVNGPCIVEKQIGDGVAVLNADPWPSSFEVIILEDDISASQDACYRHQCWLVIDGHKKSLWSDGRAYVTASVACAA